MRPYLEIIRDSFREAFASRILWLLFLMITLLLLTLLPAGYRQTVTRGLDEESIGNWPQFIEQLRAEAAQPEPSPARHVVSMLDDGTKRKLEEFKIPDGEDPAAAFKFPRLIRDIRFGINKQMEKREFYDEASWRKTPLLTDEARNFAKEGVEKLSDDDVARFNRLLMESAFKEMIEPSPPLSVRFRYLWYDIGESLPIRKSELIQALETGASTVMNWFVGVLGVFIAILVTAPIIPQTFDPGVLNLLLSKPIRRSGVFLSKFFGGCAFIALNATYLVCGLVLILGIRFGVWDAKLLLGIPVYMFIFAIYYSVSALAGLIWRNAIVCIALSILFWLACWGVGSAKILIEQYYLDKLRIVKVLFAGDDVIAANEMAAPYLWNAEQQDWQEIMVANSGEEAQRRVAMSMLPAVPIELRPIGPIYDEHNQAIVTVTRSLRNGQMALNLARRDGDWKNVRGANASIGTSALAREKDGRLLVISSLGLYRLVGDPVGKAEPVKLLGFSIPFSSSGPFQSVGPESGLVVARPLDAKINEDNGQLAIFSRGTIYILEKDTADRYRVVREKDLGLESNRSVVLGWGGTTLLVGHDDGRIAIFDPRTLTSLGEFVLEGKTPPRFIHASPRGEQFSIVLHNRKLWLYDVAHDRMSKPPVTGQGDISCAEFSPQGNLVVAHHTTRLSEYDTTGTKLVKRYSPPMPIVETAYRYAIEPLYFIFPKPGELDKTVQYIMSGKETATAGPGRPDLSNAQSQLHPWRPVISSFIFMAFVLTCGCIYINRQEF